MEFDKTEALRDRTTNGLRDEDKAEEGRPSGSEPGDSEEPEPVETEGDTLGEERSREGLVVELRRIDEEHRLDLPNNLSTINQNWR